MSRRPLLLLVALGAAALLVLSFVPGWLIQQRVLLGEGPRTLLSSPNVWQGQSLPVLAMGVGAVLAAGLVALISFALTAPPSARHVARWTVAVLLALGLGLLAASAWPIAQSGHASSVSLSPGWPLGVGAIGALVLLVIGLVATLPSRRAVAVPIALVLLAMIGGALGRQAWLNLQEDSTQHYSEGTYTRTATGGEPTETLTLTATTFRVSDRWSGSYEPDGLVIILTGDPACPQARGSYHAHAAGNAGDIRLEAIVDLCASGARERDLETGTWKRNH